MQDYSLKVLYKFIAPYKKTVAGALIALVFTASITLTIGQGLRLLVDQGFVNNSMEFLYQTVVIFISLVVLLSIGTFCRYYLVSWLGERVSSDLRLSVYNNLIDMNPGFFEENNSFEIQSRITTDTTLLQTLIGSSISIALRNAIMCIGGVIWLFITNAKLTSIVIICIPVVLFPILFFGRRVKKLSKSTQDSLAFVGAHVSETLQNIKTVQAYNFEQQSKNLFKNKVEENFKISIARIKQRAILIVAVISLVLTAIAFMILVGGKDVLNGEISPGELTSFIFYAIVVAGSIGAVSEVWSDIQRARGAINRLLELMHVKSKIANESNSFESEVQGKIEFKNVSFTYPTRENVQVLKDVSFTIKPGKYVAIVGVSGSGKSTIMDLLLHFYELDAGDIYFDDVNIKKLGLHQLREQIAIVQQAPVLFSGTIFENICYGKKDATMEDVVEASRLADIHDFIDSLPNKYNTDVGELGAKLSGGQRQRIAIARALIKKPKVLLLDEANSALDSKSSEKIQKSLKQNLSGITIVFITHRLNSIENADKIILLEKGRVVLKGTYEQVSGSDLYLNLKNIEA